MYPQLIADVNKLGDKMLFKDSYDYYV